MASTESTAGKTVLASLPLRALPRICGAAAAKFVADDAPTYGAAIAFYTVFSLGPVMVTVLAIASALFGVEAASGIIYGEIGTMVGPTGAEALAKLIASATRSGEGASAAILGPILFVFGASAVFVELQVALNAIWKIDTIKPRGVRQPTRGVMDYLRYVVDFLRVRLLGFALVIGTGFVLAVSLLVNAAIVGVAKTVAGRPFMANALALTELLWVVQLALTAVALAGIFAAIYKALPDVAIAWIDVWVGAGITAVLFVLGKAAIGAYLATTNMVSSYGATGTVIVLLVWVYYSAQVFLYGAEITWLWCAARAGPPPPAPPAPAPPPTASKPAGGAGATPRRPSSLLQD